MARYVRTLVAFTNHAPHEVWPHEIVVIPMRLADRLRATGHSPRLNHADLATSLHWELLAACAGQTLTEWAFAESSHGD